MEGYALSLEVWPEAETPAARIRYFILDKAEGTSLWALCGDTLGSGMCGSCCAGKL